MSHLWEIKIIFPTKEKETKTKEQQNQTKTLPPTTTKNGQKWLSSTNFFFCPRSQDHRKVQKNKN